MIKQRIFVSILLISILLLSACSNYSEPPESSSSGDSSAYYDTEVLTDVNDTEKVIDEKVIDEDIYYKITYSDYMFYYYIFDKNHNIARADGPLNRHPRIIMADEQLVRFTLQAGTGIGTLWGYYYDVKNDAFSEIFQCIYDQCNGMVALGGVGKVIVRDIFDDKKYYYEISCFKYPFAKSCLPITEVVFTNDGKSVEITYLTGDDYKEVSEIVDLF